MLRLAICNIINTRLIFQFGLDENSKNQRLLRNYAVPGSIALGGIALGGIAHSGIALGGIALGGIALGGIALGGIALGGIALI